MWGTNKIEYDSNHTLYSIQTNANKKQMSSTMTIEELNMRVSALEEQMVKLTVNIPVADKPVDEKPKKGCKSKKTDEEKAEAKAEKAKEKAEKKKETKKNEKKEDDEPKKKRPPTAYNMFCQQMRQEAKDKVVEEEELDENDKVPTTKVMQMLGKMWKELDEEQQKSYKPVLSDEE